MTITVTYGGIQYVLRDTEENRREMGGAARGHDAFLHFELANGETLSLVAGPGIPFAATGVGRINSSGTKSIGSR